MSKTCMVISNDVVISSGYVNKLSFIAESIWLANFKDVVCAR